MLRTSGSYDHEAGSSRTKRSRHVETIEEALLPNVHHEFLEWRTEVGEVMKTLILKNIGKRLARIGTYICDCKMDKKKGGWKSEGQSHLLWTTLRELIESEDRLIHDIPVDDVPRISTQRAPRVQRASMQDIYERMGIIEIRQEAIERMEYRQAYHWDRTVVSVENYKCAGDLQILELVLEIFPRPQVMIHLLMENQKCDQGKIKGMIIGVVEEVFEFKEVLENKMASLIVTGLRGRASTYWQKLKLTREIVENPRVDKKDYTAEFYQLIARNDIQDTNDQLVFHYIGGLRAPDYVNMFDPEIDDVADEDYEEALVFDDDPQYDEEVVTRDVGVNLVVRRSCVTPKAVGDDWLKHNIF
nr:hypothetical protein [Tanacetum cinerariifolium]